MERLSMPWLLMEAPGERAADRASRKLERSLLTFVEEKRSGGDEKRI
jgi:hypothetical protein